MDVLGSASLERRTGEMSFASTKKGNCAKMLEGCQDAKAFAESVESTVSGVAGRSRQSELEESQALRSWRLYYLISSRDLDPSECAPQDVVVVVVRDHVLGC
jgi:hypothetical protein